MSEITNRMKAATALSVWTIGHSTLDSDVFIAILRRAGIRTLADVRRFPGSRRYPQFNQGPLVAALAAAGIQYVPFPELGGRRTPRPDSRNTVWRVAGFQGYADYMETDEFHAGMRRLMDLATRLPTTIMCAEALWWRCHRSLIADYLKAEGACVIHLWEDGAEEHPYTSPSRIVDGRLAYGEDDSNA
jgi:uncharacterized protein (DUF488 family)